jgi:hypothetical protein
MAEKPAPANKPATINVLNTGFMDVSFIKLPQAEIACRLEISVAAACKREMPKRYLFVKMRENVRLTN